jgi:adhesin transport system outer membrane protein
MPIHYAWRMDRPTRAVSRASFAPCLRGLVIAAIAAIGTSGAARATPLDAVVRAALVDFPAIRAAQANRSVGEFRIEEARARHLPVFDVGAVGAISGAAASTPLPRARVNLYASGAIESSVERERQRAAALESRESVTRDDVAFGAAQAYLRTLRAWRLVAVSEANLGRHQRLADDFEEIARVDPGRRFDLVQAQARVQLVRGTLEDRLAELGSARQTLARYFPQPIEPAELALPAVAAVPPEPAPAIGSQEHPSVVAARRDVAAAEANARVLRQQRGPRLDLEALGGRDPLSQVVLSWPAFDATLAAAERGAAAARIGAEATLQDVELAIAEARRLADQDFASAGRRIDQAWRQVTLATELVTIYFEQFRVGRRNLLDLLNAYAELSNGEASLAAAEVDRALARYRISYTTGPFAPAFDGPFAGLPGVPAPEPARVPPYARTETGPAPAAPGDAATPPPATGTAAGGGTPSAPRAAPAPSAPRPRR